MPLINLLPEADRKLRDAAIIGKVKAPAKKSIKKSKNILDLLEAIRQDIEQNLGKFKDSYKCIYTKEEFEEYIDKANKHGKIAIDTETTGLNPLVDKIVGLCLYFPGEKGVYVPINHVDYFSGVRMDDQLNEKSVAEVLKKLTAKVIMHNAPFDIRVIWHNLKVRLTCWWDTQVAATLLNENEPHGLKYLHGKYISKTDEKTFSDLFGRMTFTDIPIEYAYLYATHDAVDTYELYEFQEPFFLDESRQDRLDMNWLYRNIEIPMIDVIVDLEDNGVAVDMEYLKTLYDIYHKDLDEALEKCHKFINENYKSEIDRYRALNPNCKLDNPISISSATQLAILFYDILGAHPVKGKGARCTDADVMDVFKKKYPIAQYILDYRSAQKLTSTYIDNIPNIIHTDGRVHTHFNSNGAKTGRMSSSDPINLQNIPSHDDAIRKMFIGQTTFRDVKAISNKYEFDRCEEVELKGEDNWKFVEQLKPGDELVDGEIVKSVEVKDLKVFVVVKK